MLFISTLLHNIYRRSPSGGAAGPIKYYKTGIDLYRFREYTVNETIQVQLFLLRLKKMWNTPERITLAPRQKNLQSMSALDLSMRDVKNICFGLQPGDRIAGPVLHDKKFDGEVWIFSPMYNGKKMYVKVFLTSADNQDYLEIISFHEEGMV